MNVTLIKEPFHYIKIDSLYTKEERSSMLDELVFFEKSGVFLEPDQTGSAEEGGILLKKNKAVWLDAVWRSPSASFTLRTNRRLFDVFNEEEAKESWFFNGVDINNDATLISYYESSDYYKPHRDTAYMTALTWFFEEPKKFLGGAVTFTDYDITLEVTNGTTILFPSNIKHEVSEIIMQDSDKGLQRGRFCMAQFLRVVV